MGSGSVWKKLRFSGLFACCLLPVAAGAQANTVDRKTPTKSTGAVPETKVVTHQTTIPNTSDDPNESDLQRFRSARRPHLLSSTIDGDHEDAGVITQGEVAGTVYTGTYANHLVYKSGDLKLKLPLHASRSQTLFAPTTRPPNGSCLEVGTAYTTDVTTRSTAAALYVFDFCKTGGPDWAINPAPASGSPQYPIDDGFMKAYTFLASTGNHEYTLLIYTEDTAVSSTSTWKAQLYNYESKRWDTLATSTGRFLADPRGWSIFETWFQTGQCSESLQVLGADSLRYFNSVTASWNPVQPTMNVLANTRDIGGAKNQNCFVDDVTGKASYLLLPNDVADHWQVISH